MHSIQIDIEAITEWHEPKPYEHFPALRFDTYEMSGGNPNIRTLLSHRCEDIRGLESSEDKDSALLAAREWLGENYKAVVQEAISKVGE